jgi:hypothetical protein
VPYFALSDADRASEMRADADAVLKAASQPNAVLLPVTNGKVWVVRLIKPTPEGAVWIPAEALMSTLAEGRRAWKWRHRRGGGVALEGEGESSRSRSDGRDGVAGGDLDAFADASGDELEVDDDDSDPLAHHRLSFLGFRGCDGAPVFAADVTGAEEEVTAAVVGLHKLNPVKTRSLISPGFNPCAYRVKNWFQAFAFKCNLYRYTVVKNPATSRLYPPFFTAVPATSRLYLASQIAVKDAKSVGPEMSRNDAGLLAAAGGLLKWQKNTQARLYKLHAVQSTHSLKVPAFSPCTYEVRNWWFQRLLSNAACTATPRSARVAGAPSSW